MFQVGQKTKGFLGVFMNALAKSSTHIWFERTSSEGRKEAYGRLEYLVFLKTSFLLGFEYKLIILFFQIRESCQESRFATCFNIS